MGPARPSARSGSGMRRKSTGGWRVAPVNAASQMGMMLPLSRWRGAGKAAASAAAAGSPAVTAADARYGASRSRPASRCEASRLSPSVAYTPQYDATPVA